MNRRRHNFPVALLAVALVASLGVASLAEAAFPGRNGRIAFEVSWGEEACGIATIEPDGSGLREFGCSRAARFSDNGAPDFFADGRRILVSGRGRPGVMRSDGSRRRIVPLPDGEGIGRASVAPDGRHLVFQHRRERREIWRAGLDGRGTRRIGVGQNPRWSPDGRLIAFDDMRGGIKLVNARTGERVRRLPDACAWGSLDWSPDGRRILYSPGCHPLTGGLFVVRADGRGSPRRILEPTPERAGLDHAVWSPDGRRIAFSSHRSNAGDEDKYSIWTMTARGTGIRHVLSSPWVHIDLRGNEPPLSWGPRTTQR